MKPRVFSFWERLAIALGFGLAISVLAYAAVRIMDVVLFPEPNPVVVIWTDRSRFLWRALIAMYLGGASVFGGYSLAVRNPEAAPSRLSRVVLLAGVCLLGQTVFAP